MTHPYRRSWSEPSRPWVPDRLIEPKLVDPMSCGWSASPGADQAPLCTSGTVMTEQTVDWRCARSVPASDWARATEDDTTLCDEPVSTTKLRRRPSPKPTATPSDTSPCAGVTVSGTVVPTPSPCVSTAGG